MKIKDKKEIVKITGFKGFDKDFKCRDFQYEVGKQYKHDKEVRVCHSGFHFCEHPISVFEYYAPSTSRYSSVTGMGTLVTENDKTSCSTLEVGAEISLHGMIDAAVKFVFKRAKWTKKATVTKKDQAASSTGYQGAASSTGKEGVACALGIEGKAKGALNCFLVLAEWKEIKKEWHRIDVQSIKVDGEKIKAETWYQLKDGKFTGIN